MNTKSKQWLGIVIPMLCAVLVISSMAIGGQAVKNKEQAAATSNSSQQEPETKPKTQTVSLVAVGDNLIHNTIIKSGLQADGTYDFTSCYTPMKQYIESADVAVINQETVLGGKVAEYSGYPMFNTPWEVGEAAIGAGFDVFLNATNHSMDVGTKGLLNAIKFYEQHPEITYLGINKDANEYGSVKIVEKNGIRMAMLNYTFGTNGISVPEDKSWIVNLINKDKMKSDIETAKKNADVVIVFPHWGTEYSTQISTYQEDLTAFFADNGVDLVIGAHPHVIEPVREVTGADGHKMLVYYSLGNFISHQNGVDRMLGAMADVKITKTGDDITIAGKAVPLVTHIQKNGKDAWKFEVYRLKDYTQALAGVHKESALSIEKLNKLADDILGEYKED